MNDYRIQFLRNSSSHPIGCLAISVNRLHGELSYQYSVLNPRDEFDRKIARQLALGRLVEKPIKLALPRDANMHEISTVVMSDLERSSTAPNRAVKSARLWLEHFYASRQASSSTQSFVENNDLYNDYLHPSYDDLD